jgi:BirA family biotin operon repressor/biotin-[acetyl-CoA-carboxylase] ligase
MDHRYHILTRLADGRFHSGEDLAQACGVSRAAVWKQVKLLRESFGLEVFSVRGKGYRLDRPLELLDEGWIRTQLSKRAKLRLAQLEILHQLDSTNRYLMERAMEGALSGTACLAEQQTAGRGRRGRQWVSPFGRNIYLSLLWRFQKGPAEISGLSLAAGLAVVRSLEQLGVEEVKLKWPNDVLWDGRKLAGLLLEVAGEADGPSRMVLGLGVNTRMEPEYGEMIDQPWVDLSQVPGGEGISRNRLAARLLENLSETLERFEQEGLQPLIAAWQRYDLYYGKKVFLRVGDKLVRGIHRGVNSDGALLLEQGEKLLPFHGGEVSLLRP